MKSTLALSLSALLFSVAYGSGQIFGRNCNKDLRCSYRDGVSNAICVGDAYDANLPTRCVHTCDDKSLFWVPHKDPATGYLTGVCIAENSVNKCGANQTKCSLPKSNTDSNMEATCTNMGECATRCKAGFMKDRNGVCYKPNGKDANNLSNPARCGIFRQVCTTDVLNANPVCIRGECGGFTCNSDYTMRSGQACEKNPPKNYWGWWWYKY